MLEKSIIKQRPLVYNLVSQLLLWDQSLSRFIQYATFILSNIQCILILLAYQLVFIANSDQDSFIYYLSKLCKILSLIDIIDFERHEKGIYAILGIGALYVLIFLIPFFLSLKQFWDNQKFSQEKNIFCVYFGMIHCGLGFWILNALIMNYLNFGFNEGGAAIVFGCIVLTALNYLMAFYFAVYSHDPFIGSNILSCHSRIFQIILFGFKAVAAPIIFLGDNSSKSVNWGFAILSVVILGIGHFELIRKFPYYNYTIMRIAVIFSTFATCIALMNFLALIEASKYFSSGKVLVYIEAPICSLVIRLMLIIFHRMIFSSFSSSNQGNLSQMMRRIFGVLYLIERTKPTCAEGTKRSLNEINFFGALFAKNNQKYLIKESMNQNENMAQILRGILEDTIERFNTNQQLRFMRAGLMWNNSPFEVSMMSLGELKKLQGGGPRLITIKLSERLQEKMTRFFEENRETVLDLRKFLEYETASVNLNNSIQSAIKLYKNFWSAFLNPNLKIQNFFLKSKELEKIAEDIERQWKKSVADNKYFAGVFWNKYSLFLHLLRGSPFQAQIIQQKYSQKIGTIKAENEDCFTNDSLFNANTLTIQASLTKESPGKILKLSSNFEELTGWRANDILGHPVNIFMPSFMAHSHNQLLLNHLKKLQLGQNSSKISKTLKSFFVHKDGYMFTCDVYLSLHPIVQESPVYVAFVRLKKDEQILLNEDGMIEGFTRRIDNLLDLKVKNRNHCETICANFPEIQVILEKLKQDHHSISLEEGIHFRLPQGRNTLQYPVDISCHIFDNKLYFSLSLDFEEESSMIQQDKESFLEVPEEYSERMTSLKSPHPNQILSSPNSSVKPLRFDFRKTDAEDGEKNLLCSTDRNLIVKTKREEVELKDIQSSVGSFSKHTMTKFERALKTMPTNPRVCLLYLSFILLMILSGVTLIIFQQKVSTTLDQIHSSGEVISNLIFRLMRYTDVYAYSRILWQANVGLTELNRYEQFGYTFNTIDYNVEVMAEVFADIRERNEVIRSFVYRLDPKLSQKIYSDLVPVYEIQPNGEIIQTREDNLFDLTTELVATGAKFLYSGMAFDENNPDMIFLINNTMNEPLLAGQRELPIIMDDNESKLNGLSIYTYLMIGMTFGLAIIIFVYFNDIVMKARKERNQFIFVFTNIDEKHVHEHLKLLENFQANFQKTSHHSKTHLIETQSGQRNKKTVDKKGINRTLYWIYFVLTIFLFGICSVSPLLSILIKKTSKMILKKLNLMAESNYIFYNLLYYWNIVNAYSQYGVSEYELIKGKPLIEALKLAGEGVLGVQDFFINDLLDPENGMSDNSFLYNTVVGDLCELYSFSDEILESICPTLGGGAATKGIIGLHAYHIIALNAVEQCYTQSLKTWADSKRCSGLQEIVNVEVFYPYTYNSFNNIDILIREAMVKDYDQMNGFVAGFMIAYIVFYAMYGTWAGWRIKRKLEEEITDWRKMIRQIPFGSGIESKLMKSFLQKYRKDI